MYRERENEREKERKNREKTIFFPLFLVKKKTPAKIKINKIKNALGPGPRAPVPWCPGTRDPILAARAAKEDKNDTEVPSPKIQRK